MLDDFIFEQKIPYKILKNALQKNKISHAYLIETNNYTLSFPFALAFAKALQCPKKLTNKNNCGKCTQCDRINNGNFSEIKIIEPDGLFIKKEQLSDLQKEFSTKSIESNYKIYIIKNAEKLNISAANSILKFLEEPEENIIAILVANNRYKVIDTILSRCQIISLKKFDDEVVDEDIINLVSIICDSRRSFLEINKLMEIIPDRLTALEKLKEVEKLLFSKVNDKYLNLNSEKVVSIISIIERVLERLEFNVNYKLIIDDMLVSVLEVTK